MTKSPPLAALITVLALTSLAVVSTPARAAAPELPANFSIQAAPSDRHFELRVTWTDFAGEDGYQIFATGSLSPGPLLNSNGTLRTEWSLAANLAANSTEFFDATMVGQRYGICALKQLEMTCRAPSNFATPTYPPEPADVLSMNIHERSTNSLGLTWRHSSNTVSSRVELRSGNSVVTQIANDPDHNVRFTGLSPNTSFTIRVCVQNQAQTAADETCKSAATSTLVLAPLAVSSVSVDQSDPSPTSRTVSFTYNNQQANAAVGFSVRLIKDNSILSNVILYPASGSPYGQRTYTHPFNGLTPFTGYEAWVIPYNQAGSGTSSGIGFTTPVLLQVMRTPVSADSAILRWWAPAIGEYAIEKRLSSGDWQSIGSYRSFADPNFHRVVIDRILSAQDVRVTWKLGYLRAISEPRTLAVLAATTPELIGFSGTRSFISDQMAFGTRDAVSFRTTAAGGRYELQIRTSSTGAWTTVSSIGSVQSSQTDALSANTVYELYHAFAGGRPSYRVCKDPPLTKGALTVPGITSNAPRCSESGSNPTVGLRRFNIS